MRGDFSYPLPICFYSHKVPVQSVDHDASCPHHTSLPLYPGHLKYDRYPGNLWMLQLPLPQWSPFCCFYWKLPTSPCDIISLNTVILSTDYNHICQGVATSQWAARYPAGDWASPAAAPSEVRSWAESLHIPCLSLAEGYKNSIDKVRKYRHKSYIDGARNYRYKNHIGRAGNYTAQWGRVSVVRACMPSFKPQHPHKSQAWPHMLCKTSTWGGRRGRAGRVPGAQWPACPTETTSFKYRERASLERTMRELQKDTDILL